MEIQERSGNDRKPKLVAGFSCSGYGGSPLFRHGRTTLPAYREQLLYRVTSTEQGKPVALPARGSEVARPIDGEAGVRTGRRRRTFRIEANIRFVSSIDKITGSESGRAASCSFTRETSTNTPMTPHT